MTNFEILDGTLYTDNDEAVLSLGTFEIQDGVVDLSDPCYDEGVYCRIAQVDVLPGRYEAYTVQYDEGGLWGTRCAEVVAIHTDLFNQEVNVTGWTRLSGSVGVDSGQAGIFDVGSYKNDTIVPDDFEGEIRPEEPWYSLCCNITLNGIHAGVLPGGVVSSSGYGDGGYEAFKLENEDGDIVGLKIVFIDDDWDGEEEYEEDLY